MRPETLAKLTARPSFLMVGTLEPRKGYQHIVDAFHTALARRRQTSTS
jgi:hypothetical protein